MRVAMGASRQRLVRQLLTESVLLGLLSGAVGMFVGYAGLQFLFGTLPGAANFVTPKLDATVFGFALLISLATGFVFGTIPAIKASRASSSSIAARRLAVSGSTCSSLWHGTTRVNLGQRTRCGDSFICPASATAGYALGDSISNLPPSLDRRSQDRSESY